MANTQLATRAEDNSIFSSGEKWGLAVKMATSLAQSTIVPKDFQGNANNTLVALELANRMGVSPMMVMQNLYIVYGRPSWSAQYIISSINGSGKYDFELQYDLKNDKNGKPFSCQCWTEKNGRRVVGPVIDMDMAKAEGWIDKNGSKWKTMPQMMLMYRAATFFGRMNCPELTMGIYSRDEVVEIGPEEYREVPIETRVKQDIAQNANTEAFEDDVAEVVQEPETVAEEKEEQTQTEAPKRGRPKKQPAKEVEETVIDLQETADDDPPEWA